MKTRRTGRISTDSLLIVTVLLVGSTANGCGESSETAQTPEPAATQASAQSQLPPEHPPVDPGQGDAGIAPPPPGSGTGEAGLNWQPPATWLAQPPSNAMRRAQYSVPGSGGDGECVVFYFGPGQGGSPRSNAERWAGQFTQPDGRSALEAMTTDEIEVDGIPVLLVEVSGTYSGGMMRGPSWSSPTTCSWVPSHKGRTPTGSSSSPDRPRRFASRESPSWR